MITIGRRNVRRPMCVCHDDSMFEVREVVVEGEVPGSSGDFFVRVGWVNAELVSGCQNGL